MLEELQRLQTHITHLKHRLHDTESENKTLKQAKTALVQNSDAENLKYQQIIEKKDKEINILSIQSAQLESQHQSLTQDAKTLVERYNRLEKGCNELKTRFQEILAERNELRLLKEKLQHELNSAENKITTLKDESVQLAQKNEHAKVKVEEIIERLRQLGTKDDQHAQALEQLTLSDEPNQEERS